MLSRRQIAMRIDYARHDAAVDRFLRAHPVVALQICQHLLISVAGLARDHARNTFACAQDLFRLDRDVGGRATGSTGGLVNYEARVRQADAPLPVGR